MKLLWFDRDKFLELLEITKVPIIGKRRVSKWLLVFIMIITAFIHIWQQIEFSGGFSKFLNYEEVMVPCYDDHCFLSPNESIVNSTHDVNDSYSKSLELEAISTKSSNIEAILKGILNKIGIVLLGNTMNLFYFQQFNFIALGYTLKKIGQLFSEELEETKDSVYKVCMSRYKLELFKFKKNDFTFLKSMIKYREYKRI